MSKMSAILFMSFFLGYSVVANAQQTTAAPSPPTAAAPAKIAAPIDTIKNKAGISLCEKLYVKDHSDPLFNRVVVFGNPDCGHCKEIEAMMTEKKIDFLVFDLRDMKLMLKVQDLIVQKEGTGSLSYSYPIVIYKGEINYNFKDAKAFVEELSQKVGQ